MYPLFSDSIAVADGSNSTVKSPRPDAKAAAVEPKSIFCTISTSFLQSILFFFKMYSRSICGMPPALPPMIVFPFTSLHLKLLILSLETRKLPARCVSCAKLTA